MAFPINHILQAIGLASQIANASGLPVPNLQDAVNKIHDSATLPNDAADTLNAAAIDALAAIVKKQDARINALEKLLAAKDATPSK